MEGQAAPHWLSIPSSHPFIADFFAILYAFQCVCQWIPSFPFHQRIQSQWMTLLNSCKVTNNKPKTTVVPLAGGTGSPFAP